MKYKKKSQVMIVRDTFYTKLCKYSHNTINSYNIFGESSKIMLDEALPDNDN